MYMECIRRYVSIRFNTDNTLHQVEEHLLSCNKHRRSFSVDNIRTAKEMHVAVFEIKVLCCAPSGRTGS